MPHQASTPVYASFPSERVTIAAGVAIFHLASARVVVCYHTRDKYWFLPKGRKNGNETITAAAEREGFEESGYRNRLIPLPLQHRQPDPDNGHQRFVTEPLWTQFLPLSARSQYILFWYAAETIAAEIEEWYSASQTNNNATGPPRAYRPPPAFPTDMTLMQRVAQDKKATEGGDEVVYEPIHHPNTGVDEEERLYESYLLPIADARRRLKGSVMEDVVWRGWEAIELRIEKEEDDS